MPANLSVEQSLMRAKSYAKKGDLAEAEKLSDDRLGVHGVCIRCEAGDAAAIGCDEELFVIPHDVEARIVPRGVRL